MQAPLFVSLANITIQPLDETLGQRPLATHHGLRGADAVYATVVQQAGCTLISLDHEPLTRLVGFLRVHPPKASLAELTAVPEDGTDTAFSCSILILWDMIQQHLKFARTEHFLKALCNEYL